MKFIQLLKENYESLPYVEKFQKFIGETITNPKGESFTITEIEDFATTRNIVIRGGDKVAITPKTIAKGFWTTKNQQLFDLCKEFQDVEEQKKHEQENRTWEEHQQAYTAYLQKEAEKWAEHDAKFTTAYSNIPKTLFKSLIPELNKRFSLYINPSDDLQKILLRFHHKAPEDLDAATQIVYDATVEHDANKQARREERTKNNVLADHTDTSNFKDMQRSEKALTLAWLAKYTLRITLSTNDKFSSYIMDKFKGSPYIDNHAFIETSNDDKTTSGYKRKYWWSITFSFSRNANFNSCPIVELANQPRYSYGNNGLFEILYRDHEFDFSYNNYPAANGKQDAKKIAATLSPEEQITFWDAYNNPKF